MTVPGLVLDENVAAICSHDEAGFGFFVRFVASRGAGLHRLETRPVQTASRAWGSDRICAAAAFWTTDMAKDSDNLIWIDLEMTGLQPDSDRIIEIATVVTDKQLEILAEGPVIAIHQDDAVLAGMDEWNTRQHNGSGLVKRVRDSATTEADAERRTLAFLAEYLDPGASPMCGNSICQDRRFLARWMPTLEAFFHYRNVDVSTIKELARRWYSGRADGFAKQSTHLALQDIYDSIEELRYYRSNLFLPS